MSTIFSLILVVITLISGLVWLVDSLVFAPKRKLRVATAVAGVGEQLSDAAATQAAKSQEPWLVETSRSLFPVIGLVLVLRSFIYEPFQIPSESMMPNLLVGDFLLVEKFSYGIKDPVFRNTIVETGKPERGDVAVFKYPEDPRLDYIKRVIGLPGDTISYRNKMFTINPKCEEGAPAESCAEFTAQLSDPRRSEYTSGPIALTELNEDLGGVEHAVVHNPVAPQMTSLYKHQPGLPPNTWVVPEGHYFMVGDNRDGSGDSRFWGFVPEENMVGRASVIWMSFSLDKNEGSFLPSWVPTSVRLNRIGGIN